MQLLLSFFFLQPLFPKLTEPSEKKRKKKDKEDQTRPDPAWKGKEKRKRRRHLVWKEKEKKRRCINQTHWTQWRKKKVKSCGWL